MDRGRVSPWVLMIGGGVAGGGEFRGDVVEVGCGGARWTAEDAAAVLTFFKV